MLSKKPEANVGVNAGPCKGPPELWGGLQHWPKCSANYFWLCHQMPVALENHFPGSYSLWRVR